MYKKLGSTWKKICSALSPSFFFFPLKQKSQEHIAKNNCILVTCKFVFCQILSVMLPIPHAVYSRQAFQLYVPDFTAPFIRINHQFFGLSCLGSISYLHHRIWTDKDTGNVLLLCYIKWLMMLIWANDSFWVVTILLSLILNFSNLWKLSWLFIFIWKSYFYSYCLYCLRLVHKNLLLLWRF